MYFVIMYAIYSSKEPYKANTTALIASLLAVYSSAVTNNSSSCISVSSLHQCCN